MVVHARRETFHNVRRSGIGRHCDDGHTGISALLQRTNSRSGFIAIHFRHIAIHQDQIPCFPLKGLHCHTTVASQLWLATQHFKHAGGNHLAGAVVFNHQHLGNPIPHRRNHAVQAGSRAKHSA